MSNKLLTLYINTIYQIPMAEHLEEEPIPNQSDNNHQFSTNQDLTITDSHSSVHINPNRKKFGNMVVLFSRGNFVISLGPDYICFLPTFIIFFGLSILLCWSIYSNFQNIWVHIYATLISLVQCGSYLFVATFNPGFVFPSSIEIENDLKFRKCKKCGAIMRRRTFHCRDCDMCIEGFDHHCPWTSKCIGKGNIVPFYVFIVSTPIFMISAIFLMMSVLIVMAEKANVHHKLL